MSRFAHFNPDDPEGAMDALIDRADLARKMARENPPPLGSINCTVPAPARLGRKRFIFDSTIKGLVLAALDNGASEGSIVHANFGAGFNSYRIVAAPHDDRARGFWADKVRT